MIKELTIATDDSNKLNNLCGSLNSNLLLIEKLLSVSINNRSELFIIEGNSKAVHLTVILLEELYSKCSTEEINENLIDVTLDRLQEIKSTHIPDIIIKTRGKTIKPRGENQAIYLSEITKNDVNFGIGPAGTGKTYLAVASAVEAFNKKQVERIVLVRPAVEAGEKLGFLPGDLADKVDPYLRPLYDALYEMMGMENVEKLLEKNIIEVAPLAFMRGRTLNNSYILLDEAQNTTSEQMKMFLTRLGFGSTAIITGDLTQVDLGHNVRSGLTDAVDILQGVVGIHFSFFEPKDVVRHPLVKRIVRAYESQNI